MTQHLFSSGVEPLFEAAVPLSFHPAGPHTLTVHTNHLAKDKHVYTLRHESDLKWLIVLAATGEVVGRETSLMSAKRMTQHLFETQNPLALEGVSGS